MKRNNEYYYSAISSFEDLRLEKSRLILKGKLIESKIDIDFIQVKQSFSISAIALSLFRKLMPKELSGFVDSLFGG